MTTDEERREVAENLRHLSYGNRVRYKEEFFEILDETVMEPDTGYHEINDVFARLANLIDPQERTCHDARLTADRKYTAWRFICSRCGASLGDGAVTDAADEEIEPRYCPHCGARIVEVDE